jgi:hypothetical protein
MAYSNDVTKGIAIGAGLVLLVPLAAVTLAPIARPLLRQALKTGMLAYEKGQEALAEFGETFEDVAAEVQAELREARSSAAETAEAETLEGELGPAGVDSGNATK